MHIMKKRSRGIKKSRVKCNTPPTLSLLFCNLASPAATIRVSHKCVHKFLTNIRTYENKYKHKVLKAQMMKTLLTFLHLVFSFISFGSCSVSYTKINLIACNYSITVQWMTYHDSFNSWPTDRLLGGFQDIVATNDTYLYIIWGLV